MHVTKSSVETKIKQLCEADPLFHVNRFSEKYGPASNEALWARAMNGDRKALDRLYKQVQGLWASKVWLDRSDVHTYDDWLGVAGVTFSIEWKGYNPWSGFRFSTYIMTSIRNGWKNEKVALSCDCRRLNQEATVISSLENFEVMLLEEFTNYRADDFFTAFLDQFRAFMASRVAPLTVQVYDAHFTADEIKPSDLARLLRIKPSDVVKSIMEIKTLISQFCTLRKGLAYAS